MTFGVTIEQRFKRDFVRCLQLSSRAARDWFPVAVATKVTENDLSKLKVGGLHFAASKSAGWQLRKWSANAVLSASNFSPI